MKKIELVLPPDILAMDATAAGTALVVGAMAGNGPMILTKNGITYLRTVRNGKATVLAVYKFDALFYFAMQLAADLIGKPYITVSLITSSPYLEPSVGVEPPTVYGRTTNLIPVQMRVDASHLNLQPPYFMRTLYEATGDVYGEHSYKFISVYNVGAVDTPDDIQCVYPMKDELGNVTALRKSTYTVPADSPLHISQASIVAACCTTQPLQTVVAPATNPKTYLLVFTNTLLLHVLDVTNPVAVLVGSAPYVDIIKLVFEWVEDVLFAFSADMQYYNLAVTGTARIARVDNAVTNITDADEARVFEAMTQFRRQSLLKNAASGSASIVQASEPTGLYPAPHVNTLKLFHMDRDGMRIGTTTLQGSSGLTTAIMATWVNLAPFPLSRGLEYVEGYYGYGPSKLHMFAPARAADTPTYLSVELGADPYRYGNMVFDPTPTYDERGEGFYVTKYVQFWQYATVSEVISGTGMYLHWRPKLGDALASLEDLAPGTPIASVQPPANMMFALPYGGAEAYPVIDVNNGTALCGVSDSGKTLIRSAQVACAMLMSHNGSYPTGSGVYGKYGELFVFGSIPLDLTDDLGPDFTIVTSDPTDVYHRAVVLGKYALLCVHTQTPLKQRTRVYNELGIIVYQTDATNSYLYVALLRGITKTFVVDALAGVVRDLDTGIDIAFDEGAKTALTNSVVGASMAIYDPDTDTIYVVEDGSFYSPPALVAAIVNIERGTPRIVFASAGLQYGVQQHLRADGITAKAMLRTARTTPTWTEMDHHERNGLQLNSVRVSQPRRLAILNAAAVRAGLDVTFT